MPALVKHVVANLVLVTIGLVAVGFGGAALSLRETHPHARR